MDRIEWTNAQDPKNWNVDSDRILDIDPESECDALASYRDHAARVEREEREVRA